MIKGKLHRLIIPVAIVIITAVVLIIIFAGKENNASVKIGFVMTGSTTDIGWNGMHYSAVESACEKLGAELMVRENVTENTDACSSAIKSLAENGADMIILSSYGYPTEALETIKSYPDISFYAISTNIDVDNVTSYFGRMYQARYLAGIVAGMHTETGSIGYAAAMPNSEVNRGINAFTLGVRSVNPNATVNVVWTNSWDNSEAEATAVERLVSELDADVITYHQNRHSVAETADKLGAYSIGYNTEANGLSYKYLTAAVWNWDSVYFQILREFIQGEGNSKELHWYGIDSGVVGLSEYSPLVTKEATVEVEKAKAEILKGKDVFSGTIRDNNGTVRCEEGETINDDTLFNNMDWYVDGVMIYE